MPRGRLHQIQDHSPNPLCDLKRWPPDDTGYDLADRSTWVPNQIQITIKISLLAFLFREEPISIAAQMENWAYLQPLGPVLR